AIAALVTANLFGIVDYAARSSTGAAAWAHIQWHDASQLSASYERGFRANWWEARNAVHVRDTAFIQAANTILEATARLRAPQPVTYASAQAGMVIYYLQQRAIQRGQPFKFIDAEGLSDATWDRCRDGLTASRWGTLVPFDRVVDGECGALPDI